jgi:hypothetical protein
VTANAVRGHPSPRAGDRLDAAGPDAITRGGRAAWRVPHSAAPYPRAEALARAGDPAGDITPRAEYVEDFFRAVLRHYRVPPNDSLAERVAFRMS